MNYKFISLMFLLLSMGQINAETNEIKKSDKDINFISNVYCAYEDKLYSVESRLCQYKNDTKQKYLYKCDFIVRSPKDHSKNSGDQDRTLNDFKILMAAWQYEGPDSSCD